MDINGVLNILEDNEISIELNGEDLDVSFSQEIIPDEVINLLKLNKGLIVSHLKKITHSPSFQLIPSIPSDISYPLSSSQMRLWILSQYEDVSLAYNLPFSFKLIGDYDLDILEKSILALIRRHETLRTVFKQNEEGNIMQWIMPADDNDFKVEINDYSNLENAQLKMEEHITLDKTIPFDLEEGPLFRVIVFKLEEQSHICYYNMHHIISDGLSMNILVRDITSFYRGISLNQETGLTDLRIQYKDYAAWQRQQLDDGLYETHRSFWTNKLSGDLPRLNLTGDSKGSGVKTYNGRLLGGYISTEVTQQARNYIKANGGSLYMFLVASLKTLFHKYTGDTDITIGSPVAGRDHADLEDQIGCYINTIAIRNTINDKMTFDEFYAQVKNNLLEIYAHQVYPFDYLVNDLGIKRDSGRNPIFDVMVALQNTENYENEERVSEIFLGGKDHDKLVNAKFNLEIAFVEVGDRIGIGINYNTGVYDHGFVLNLIDNFHYFIGKLLTNSDTQIGLLDYLAENELNKVLSYSAEDSTAYPKDKSIVSLFEEQVAKTPDNVAVIFEDKSFTYSQIDSLSNKLTNCLIEDYDIQPGDFVSLALVRSEWIIIAIFGVLKTGAAYVPIDSNSPKDRTSLIKEDCKSKILIDDDFIRAFINKDFPQTKPSVKIPPKDLAYVIYTSGSTGAPKGVMIRHYNVVRLFFNDDMLFDFNSEDTWCLFHSYAFDFSVWEIFGALLFGGALVIPNKFEINDPAQFSNLLIKHNVTVFNQTPSSFESLNERLLDSGFQFNIRTIIFGGEALYPSFLKRWSEHYPDCKLVNMYGITEITVHATYKEIKNDDINLNVSNIGKSIPTLNCYILDDNLAFAPIGVKGELYISGEGVAKGYLNREELTSQRFIDNPFSNGLMYKTGDIGKWLDNGDIEFLGRKDFQVKLRGYRIELGEIEEVLKDFSDDIKQVVVELVERNGHQSLAAFYTHKEEVDKKIMQAYLDEKLPPYMVPTFFVSLEEIPLTHNGKVNRKALRASTFDNTSGQNYVAPSNINEEVLVNIWKEVLGMEKIGIRDDFFEIGGNSLLTQQVLNKIYKELKSGISYRKFFDAPTIEEIAKNLNLKAFEEIPKAEIQSSYPLTPPQQQVWVLSQLEDGSAAYNMPGLVKLKGKPNLEILQQAFQLLLERHEVLRTSFKPDEVGQTRQFVEPLSTIDTTVLYLDLSDKLQPEIDEFLLEQYTTSFDLTTAPLIKAMLVKTGEDAYIFTYVIHHIINDGWSMELMVREFVYFYNQLMQELPIEMPELTLQYKDYSVWLSKQVEGKDYQDAEQYWLTKFSGEIPILELPSFKKRPLIKTYNGRSIRHQYDPVFLKKLQAFSLKNEVTIFMTIMAGLNALFYRYTGQNDIIIGTPIAGREHPDLENQMGLYLNTLAIRTGVQDDDRFSDLLERQKNTLFEAYEHQVYPFDKLVSKVNFDRDASRSPIFDVMVVFLNLSGVQTFQTDLTLQDVEALPHVVEGKTAQFDLSIVFEATDTLELIIEYNTDIFDEFLMTRLFDHFENLLNQAVDTPTKKLLSIDYLTKEESNQILIDFNNTAVDYPKDKTFVSFFEEQVIETPNNIAVAFEGKNLTYAALNKVSNQLANYLRKNYNIQKDDLVGIKLERSESLLVSILGVLKSGAAYVPIDISYPEQRIDYIEEDSNCKVIINQGLLNDFVSVSDQIDSSNLTHPIEKEDLAYIIYTSGTTGKPKGVMLSHSNLIDYVLTFKSYFNLTKKDKILQQASISFDTSIEEIFPILVSGGTLVILKERKDITSLAKVCEEEKISILSTNPFALNYINQIYNETAFDFRLLISGGDVIKPEYITNIYNDCKIYNTYGPTESTVCASYYEIESLSMDQSIPIGRPISNRKIFIVNKQNQDLLEPVGIPGKLFISGDGLAKGYLNKDELTAEKFINNPFEDEQRMYDTGDLARWLPDGNIEFQGRVDFQVKIRGYRIELGEIENTILSFSDDFNQVVTLINKSSNKEILVAYYTENKPIDQKALKRYLKERIPIYMIPSAFTLLEEIPLTANNKIDRKSLEKIEIVYENNSTYEEPRNEVEHMLVEIWQDILGADKIGIEDNFFDLGGHSLNIPQILFQSNKRLGTELTYTNIFQSPTIIQLAEIIEKIGRNNSSHVILEDVFLMKKDANSTKNIFFIHDGVGSVSGYSSLINTIDGFNCWGIKSVLFKKIFPQNLDLIEVVKSYLDKIKLIQPEGPYSLVGWSGGGPIAFEMVKQLEADNELIDFLMMIDSTFPGRLGAGTSLPYTLNNEMDLYSNLKPEFVDLMSEVSNLEEFWSLIIEMTDQDEIMKKFLMRSIWEYGDEGEKSDFDKMTTREKIVHYNSVRSITRMIGTYTYEPSESPWIYMKAEDTDILDMDELKTYSKDEVKVIEMEGDHYTVMLQPKVQQIWKVIQRNSNSIEKKFDNINYL